MSPQTSGTRRRATMRDVAALAGVGLKTVSRVVIDEPNVSTETKERIERAIDDLGFEPNHGAGSLRRGGGRTQTIGLILDAVDNPFSAAINRAVETVAAARRQFPDPGHGHQDRPEAVAVDGRRSHGNVPACSCISSASG